MANSLTTTKGANLVIDGAEIDSLIEDMNTALKAVQDVVNTLEPITDTETLTNTETTDLKRIKTHLSVAIRQAREAKTEFRKAWQKPMNEVGKLFDNELAKAYQLLDTFKDTLNTREHSLRAERTEILRQVYVEFCENNGYSELPNSLPFEKLFEPSWLNGGKAWSAHKAGALVAEKAQKVLKDLRLLEQLKPSIFDPDAAKLYYFDCLELTKTLDHDKQLKANTEALKALQAEQAENAAFKAQETERKYVITITATNEQLHRALGEIDHLGIEYTCEEAN